MSRDATPEWISTGAAARLMQVSQKTVTRYADKGLIPSKKLPSGHRKVMLPQGWSNGQKGQNSPEK